MRNYQLSTVNYRFSLLIVICLFFCPPSFASEHREVVRIAIFRGTAAIIGGGDAVSISGIVDREKVPVLGDSELEIKASGDRVLVNGTAYPSLSIDSKKYCIKVNGKCYRGKIEVLKDRSGLLIVNELDLEDYLVGLINQEISSKWPIEAVKAQAVVARTYALYQKKAKKDPRYDLESTVTSQVYGGSDSEDVPAFLAVKETEGEVALYNGELIQALYHSSCGGETESSRDMWGKDFPYLKRIKDPYCTEAPNYFWQYNITSKELSDKLRRQNGRIGDVVSLSILNRSGSGRVTRVLVRHSRGSFELAGKDFREAIGLDKIRSTYFTVKRMKGDSFYFAGSGGGHGVGMCQWGAKGMAEKGHTYKEILNWYYPGITIRRAY